MHLNPPPLLDTGLACLALMARFLRTLVDAEQLRHGSGRLDGDKVQLTPGMSVAAEVKTGNRRVIEYLLSPLLKLKDESCKERFSREFMTHQTAFVRLKII